MSDSILTALLYLSAIFFSLAYLAILGCLFSCVFEELTRQYNLTRRNRHG